MWVSLGFLPAWRPQGGGRRCPSYLFFLGRHVTSLPERSVGYTESEAHHLSRGGEAGSDSCWGSSKVLGEHKIPWGPSLGDQAVTGATIRRAATKLPAPVNPENSQPALEIAVIGPSFTDGEAEARKVEKVASTDLRGRSWVCGGRRRSKIQSSGAPLEVQWLSVRLAMQGHRFDSWSQRSPHATEEHSPCNTAIEATLHDEEPQNEKLTHRNRAHPRLPQAENEDPAQPKQK